MVSMIAALAENRVIGNKGQIPWHIPEDFKQFKEKTQDQVVIMGRKTWDSLPEKFRPLPNRINIVISRELKDGYPHWAYDLKTALLYAKLTHPEKEVFLIGGARVYEEGIKLANKMYLSYVKGSYIGDTYFPDFEKGEWKVVNEEDFDKFTLRTFIRKVL